MNVIRISETILSIDSTLVDISNDNVYAIGSGIVLGRSRIKAIIDFLEDEFQNFRKLASLRVYELLIELGIKTE